MAKYNMNSSIINVNCPEIDKILKYDEPSQFTCLEKIYNMDVLNVLSKLDPTASNYNSIPDALYYQDIANLKQLKKFNGKNGHAVTYKKTIGPLEICNMKVKNEQIFIREICKSINLLYKDSIYTNNNIIC